MMSVVDLYKQAIRHLTGGGTMDSEILRECYLRLSVDLDKAVSDNLPTENIARDREDVMWLIEHL